METVATLTVSGIVFMTISWVAIISLGIFCFSRIFRSQNKG